MSVFLLRRTASLVITLLGGSVVVFGALMLLAGDPITALLGPEASPEAIEQLRERFGLNVPYWRQYLDWIVGFVQLDLGEAFFSR